MLSPELDARVGKSIQVNSQGMIVNTPNGQENRTAGGWEGLGRANHQIGYMSPRISKKSMKERLTNNRRAFYLQHRLRFQWLWWALEVGQGGYVMRMVHGWVFFSAYVPWLATSDGLLGTGYGGPAVRPFASTGFLRL